MKILILVFAFVTGFSYAQVYNVQEQYNKLSKTDKALYDKFKRQDSIREVKINSYLLNHPEVKMRYVQGNTSYVLSDIIDDTPIYKSTDNTESALASGTNQLQEGGLLNLNLDGSGLLIGVWDGGPVQQNHPEFVDDEGNSRVTNIDNTGTQGGSEPSDHATHVTGTIAASGVNPNAKGMAPNANIISYNFNNDLTEMTLAVGNNPIILSNHSYGVGVSNDGNTIPSWIMGAYDSQARDLDELAVAHPEYLIVASAGNSGNVSYTGGLFTGFDKLTRDKNAKNNLVVANSNPEVNIFTNTVTSNPINTSSSQGPTDDLRIKPDITADGTNLESSIPTDAYDSFTGTSMAAPTVTGTLALLQQYYEQMNGNYMKAATIKGLVCHTATDDNFRVGPDPIFGWGFLNAVFAAETITKNSNGQALIEEKNLTQDGTYSLTFNAQSGDLIMASISWTDVPGIPVSGSENLNNTTPRLINDLDLRIEKDGTTFLPWTLDYSEDSGFSNSKADNVVDNFEKIEFTAPSSGTYTLTVSHKNSLVHPDPFVIFGDQDYSLILTGENMTLSNEDFALDSIKVWPNPSTGFLNIKAPNGNTLNYSVFDLQGRLLKKGYIKNNQERININDLDNGVYLLKMSDGKQSAVKKIIKK